MQETQHTIAQWADATFGEVRSDAAHVPRAMREMAELADTVANDPRNPNVVDGAADVVICLTRLGERLGIDVICEARREYETGGSDPLRAFVEANNCFSQLYESVNIPSNPEADAVGAMLSIVAWLSWMCRCVGAELGSAIDVQMTLNRRGQWRRDGRGHGDRLTPAEAVAVRGFVESGTQSNGAAA